MNRSYWATVQGVALMCLFSALAGANPEITVDLPGGAKMEFVWVEPGTFAMGLPSSEPGWSVAEGPQHQVTISRGFYLGKYETTQGQWQAVMGTQPWLGQSYEQSNPSNPAGYISWEDVQAFIHRSNQAVGDSLYRLPTEAEWEYACRAGTQTRWSFGDDESQLGDYAWYDANAWKAKLIWAQSVGQKKPNPWGLLRQLRGASGEEQVASGPSSAREGPRTQHLDRAAEDYLGQRPGAIRDQNIAGLRGHADHRDRRITRHRHEDAAAGREPAWF